MGHATGRGLTGALVLAVCVITGCSAVGAPRPQTASDGTATASEARAAPGEAVAVPAPTSSPELKRLITRCVRTGDSSALVQATRMAGFSEISAELAARPAILQPLLEKRPGVRTDRLPGEVAAAAYGESGDIHVVCVDTQRVDEPDHFGNPTRQRSRAMYLVKRERWSEPEPLVGDLLHIEGARLVLRKNASVDVLLWGDNTRSTRNAMRVPPGACDVLVMTRQTKGGWTEPLSLLARHPRLIRGIDCTTADGETLGVVWSAYREGLAEILYRRRVAGHWEEEQVLPGMPDHSMLCPVLRPLNGGLRIFAIAQTRDARSTSVWELSRSDGQWAEPQMLLGHTRPWDLNTSLPENPFLICALSAPKDTPGKYVILRANPDGGATPTGEVPVPDSGITVTPGYGWSTPLVAAGPDEVPYIVMGESGNLYLVRPSRAGPKAVCLALGSHTKTARADFVALRGAQLHLAWTVHGDKNSESRYSVRPLPADGWEDLDAVLWKTRAGRGLTRRDELFLGPYILTKARELEKKPDLVGAIAWYIHIAGGLESARTGAVKRLLELHRAGHVEVMQAVLAYVREHPEAKKPGHPIRRIMEIMGLAEPTVFR